MEPCSRKFSALRVDDVPGFSTLRVGGEAAEPVDKRSYPVLGE